MRLRSLNKFWLLYCLSWGIFLSAQCAVPKKPIILYPVYDEAGLLTKEEREQLNQKLIKFEDSTSTEIEVIIIKSAKGEDINFLATKFGQEWKIGKKKSDNGVVFLIATEDRKMSIQQGRAVEQYLTASVTGQILDYLVTPNFRTGNWYQGIDKGTNAIMEAVQGKFQRKKQESEPPMVLVIGTILFIVILIFIAKNDKGKGYFDDVVISRQGRRNYPGGFHSFPSFDSKNLGSDDRGFGGFGGGGNFGGGGASGSW